MILSFSKFVVIAGLQMTELQGYGYRLILYIFEVSHRVANVNLLINLISVCKKIFTVLYTSF